jgi:hypothetical protein
MRTIWMLTLLLLMAACSWSTQQPLNPATANQAPTPTSIQTMTPSRTTVQTISPADTPLPPATPSASIQEPPLVFFTSEQGKFQVWLPASDSVQEYTDKRTLFGVTIECPTLFYRLNGAYAIVLYCDLVPESTVGLSNDEILAQARSEMLLGIKSRVDIQQRVIVQDSYPALALSGLVDMRGLGYDGTFKGHIILAEYRIYLVAMSVYQEDWCSCLNQMEQVVDSLFIDPDLSIPFEPAP